MVAMQQKRRERERGDLSLHPPLPPSAGKRELLMRGSSDSAWMWMSVMATRPPHTVMVWLWPATKAPRGHLSPRHGAKKNGKKQAETGGSG